MLRRGEYRTLAAAGEAVAYGRFSGDEQPDLVVVLNAADALARLTVTDGRLSDGRFEALDLPGWMSAKIDRMQSGALSIEVPGRTGSVIRVVRSAS